MLRHLEALGFGVSLALAAALYAWLGLVLIGCGGAGFTAAIADDASALDDATTSPDVVDGGKFGSEVGSEVGSELDASDDAPQLADVADVVDAQLADVVDAHAWGPTCFTIVPGTGQGACGGPWFASYGMVAACGSTYCCNVGGACAQPDVVRCNAGACSSGDVSKGNVTCASDGGPICCMSRCP